MTDFFADTYAILALLAGDPAYERRFRTGSHRTSVLNLYEALYAQLARQVPAEEASDNLCPFEAGAASPDWETLREAAAFRLQLKRRGRGCSYIDAAGFAQARRLGLPFLTGDPAFEGVDGVELLRERSGKGAR